MKITIELDVDNFTGDYYKQLSAESKQHLINEVAEILRTTVNNEQKEKITLLLEELKKDNGGDFDPEVLYEILRRDD